MEITKLKPPYPRAKALSIQRYSFLYTGFLPLPKIVKFRWPTLGRVLTERQSRRKFQTQLSFQELAGIVWHSARLRDKRVLENGFVWESRIAPSGGGCHPIHIVILGAPDFPRDVLIYDAEHDGFGVISSVEDRILRKALREIDRCLRVGKGTVLWFFADIAKTAGKYVNPESLIWRDSGALLATFLFVVEGMGLQACGLGIHDTPSLRKIFTLPPTVIGVGGCIVAA